MDKCVFHDEFKQTVESTKKDLKEVGDATLLNTNKIKSCEKDFINFKNEVNEFKREITSTVDGQRKEIMSFLRWAVVFAFTIFVFVFGVIQWLIDKK